MNCEETTVSPEAIAPLGRWMLHEKVVLDFDLARLYEAQTGAHNRAVKRDMDRLPADYMFQLSAQEWEDLECQSGISRGTPSV